MLNPSDPLLTYSLDGDSWLWGGKLAGHPEKLLADQAASKIQYVWEQLAEWLPADLVPNVRSFTLDTDSDLDIAVEGLRRSQTINRIAGMKIRLLPVRGVTAPQKQPANIPRGSYRPLLERGGWVNPQLPAGQLLHRALTRVFHSAVSPKGDANRAMRLANVSFELDGSDLLLLATDGHRLTLHRLVGFSKVVGRMPKTEAVVPVADLKALLSKLKNASDVRLDLSDHEGPTHVYSYGFEGSYGPKLVDAFTGALIVDGESLAIPVVQNEFIKWRHVFPKPEWNATVDSQELLSVVSDLHDKWTAAMKSRPKGSSKKEPSGRLLFEKNRLHLEITPEMAGEAETYSADMVTSGLSQNRAVRFYMNFRYLKDALKLLDDPVVIAGENDGSKSLDGHTYLVKPVSFLDPAGPTEILIMPMYPPR